MALQSGAVADLRLGTSGWSYPEWVGRFYPNGTQPGRMLDFYGRIFATVEAHSTYRRAPDISTLVRWRSQVPADFKFAPKVHLAITHRRDLQGVEDRLGAFYQAVSTLGSNLGPLLFSLPYQQPDLDRLDRLLAGLPPGGPQAAFDLAPAWLIPAVFDRLEAHGASVVLTDCERGEPPVLHVGPLVYVRLRRERYDRAQLEAWANRLAAEAAAGFETYAFFKHDDVGDGPRYARRLADAVTRKNPEASGFDVPGGEAPDAMAQDVQAPRSEIS